MFSSQFVARHDEGCEVNTRRETRLTHQSEPPHPLMHPRRRCRIVVSACVFMPPAAATAPARTVLEQSYLQLNTNECQETTRKSAAG